MKMFSFRSFCRLGAAALVFGLSSVLAGCSREPSALEIEKTMRADAAESNSVVIHEVRKIGCVRAQGAPGYACDVELDATVTQAMPFGRPLQLPRNKSIVKLRMFEDDGKWKASMI
jgi:hypothetical protein